jgi:hypothetical protein
VSSIYKRMGVDPGARLLFPGRGPGKVGRMYIKFNPAQIGELLKSPEVQNELLRRAQAAADAATAAATEEGAEFEAYTLEGADRIHGYVKTANRAAQLAEAEDRTLTRAIDAAR